MGKIFTEAREKVTQEKDDGRDPEGTVAVATEADHWTQMNRGFGE